MRRGGARRYARAARRYHRSRRRYRGPYISVPSVAVPSYYYADPYYDYDPYYSSGYDYTPAPAPG
ncbi:MAG: hypothetical protein AAGF81_23135, partial [Pseudomonadota bacterium]